MSRLHAIPALALVAAPAAAQKGYLGFESGGGIDLGSGLKWFLLVAALGGLGHLGYWLVTTKLKNRPRRSRGPSKKVQQSKDFQDRASHLGFKHGEARTVERIATRLAPKSPANLLKSGSGREYLIGDLERRIGRREREIKVLGRIKERLIVLREQDVHERETARVEANIAVWVSKRGLSREEMAALVEDEDEAEAEAMFGNLDSVSGKLLDISEGGAAIEVEIEVARGDQIQFWSGSPQIVLGETKAGVVSTEEKDGAKVLHLHFIDPDLRELRAVIAELRGEDDVGEPD